MFAEWESWEKLVEEGVGNIPGRNFLFQDRQMRTLWPPYVCKDFSLGKWGVGAENWDERLEGCWGDYPGDPWTPLG